MRLKLIFLFAVIALSITSVLVTKGKPEESINRFEQMRDTTLKVIKEGRLIATAVYYQDDLVLTAGHVCSSLNIDTDVLQTSKNKLLKIKRMFFIDIASMLGSSDLYEDVCVVQLKGSLKGRLPHNILGDSDALGTKVYLAGFSGALPYSIRMGTIVINGPMLVNGSPAPVLENMVNIDAVPGISGSGAFSEDGKIIGIVSIVNFAAGQTGIVPLESIKRAVADALRFKTSSN